MLKVSSSLHCTQILCNLVLFKGAVVVGPWRSLNLEHLTCVPWLRDVASGSSEQFWSSPLFARQPLTQPGKTRPPSSPQKNRMFPPKAVKFITWHMGEVALVRRGSTAYWACLRPRAGAWAALGQVEATFPPSQTWPLDCAGRQRSSHLDSPKMCSLPGNVSQRRFLNRSVFLPQPS